MSTTISFDEVTDLICQFCRIGKSHIITPNTNLEKDLGVTGDDGIELLEHVAETFHLKLATLEHSYQKLFSLKPDEVLFHHEGIDILSIVGMFRRLSNQPHYTVRDLTVGQLYEVIVHAQNMKDSESKED